MQQKLPKENENGQKRLLILDEIEVVKRKKCELTSCVEMLSKNVNKYYDQEFQDNKILFIEAITIRRSVIEKKKTIAELDNALEN